MKRIATLGLALSFLTGLVIDTQAEARPWQRRVNARQCHQQQRIGTGLTSGNLTGREARKIEKREAKLAAQERRMRASGNGLSAKEHSKLQAEQNALSKNIYNQKHDGQTR